MKMKRALYVSSIWTKASGKEPSQGLSPADYGWEKVEGTWSPIWYHGSPLPEKLNDGDFREVKEEEPDEDEVEEEADKDEVEEEPWSEDDTDDEE